MRKFFAAILLACLFTTSLAKAYAQDGAKKTTVNTNIPGYNKQVAGDLTISPRDSSFNNLTWQFNGTVDGKQGTAGETVEGRWSGLTYNGQVTEIAGWNKPGIAKPPIPMPVTAEAKGSNIDIIFKAGRTDSVTVTISRPTGSSGGQTLLPQTGGEETMLPTVIGAGLILLTAGSALALGSR